MKYASRQTSPSLLSEQLPPSELHLESLQHCLLEKDDSWPRGNHRFPEKCNITRIEMKWKKLGLEFQSQGSLTEENFQTLLLNSQGNKRGLCIWPPPRLKT